jgi:uncharacterized OB-fold protein
MRHVSAQELRKCETMPALASGVKFPQVYCSQCGKVFGPGRSGHSHCDNHEGLVPVPAGQALEFVELSNRAKALGMRLVPIDGPTCNDYQEGVVR